MRVLILGPDHEGGSLPPYLDALTTGLRNAGVHADRHGSTGIPYDQDRQRFWPIDRIISQARALADRIDPTVYDIVAVHSGNLEIDGLVPAFWPAHRRPPPVYHVHTLEPTLFRDHAPHPHWNRVLTDQIAAADAHIYFGHHGLNRLTSIVAGHRPHRIAWLPTTIPDDTQPQPSPALARALHAPPGRPVISLYGYAAPWKDATLLTTALRLMRTPARIVLAGQFWDDTAAATDLRLSAGGAIDVGVTELVLVPEYVGAAGRAALISASTAGVFPYRAHPSFQGSGAIADYLAHGVPVVATDVANMAELIGPAGHVVPADDPTALADALDKTITGHADIAEHARQRAPLFTANTHATRCAQLYQQVIASRTETRT